MSSLVAPAVFCLRHLRNATDNPATAHTNTAMGSTHTNESSPVAREVAAGVKTDTEIIGAISDSFNAQILLVPRATGLDSLVWVLPIAVLVCAVAGLSVAFRKWRRQNTAGATSDDIDLVNKLLAQGEDPTDDENV